jgi:hypothetical protein
MSTAEGNLPEQEEEEAFFEARQAMSNSTLAEVSEEIDVPETESTTGSTEAALQGTAMVPLETEESAAQIDVPETESTTGSTEAALQGTSTVPLETEESVAGHPFTPPYGGENLPSQLDYKDQGLDLKMIDVQPLLLAHATLVEDDHVPPSIDGRFPSAANPPQEVHGPPLDEGVATQPASDTYPYRASWIPAASSSSLGQW